MGTIRFIFPSGQETPEPSEDLLRGTIFNSDERFWQSGSGDGAIVYSEDDFNAQLVLVMKESHGFFVLYSNFDEEDEYVATSGKQGTQPVIVHIGGNATKLPEHYFISRELTWEAVKEFSQSGTRAKSLQWVVFDPPDPE